MAQDCHDPETLDRCADSDRPLIVQRCSPTAALRQLADGIQKGPPFSHGPSLRGGGGVAGRVSYADRGQQGNGGLGGGFLRDKRWHGQEPAEHTHHEAEANPRP